jgi:hypothetical protein
LVAEVDERDGRERSRCLGGAGGQQDLVWPGELGDSGGEVDGGADPVSATSGGLSAVQADLHGGQARLLAEFLSDTQAEQYRLVGGGGTHHNGITNGVNVAGAVRFFGGAHPLTEGLSDFVGARVAVVSVSAVYPARPANTKLPTSSLTVSVPLPGVVAGV